MPSLDAICGKSPHCSKILSETHASDHHRSKFGGVFDAHEIKVRSGARVDSRCASHNANGHRQGEAPVEATILQRCPIGHRSIGTMGVHWEGMTSASIALQSCPQASAIAEIAFITPLLFVTAR